MRRYTNLQYFFTVFILCFMNLGYNAQILELYEGDICRKGNGKSPDSICRNIENCPVAKEGIKKNIIPQLCSFSGSIPIVCCPPANKTLTIPPSTIQPPKPSTSTTKKPIVGTYSATEMCAQYSELIYYIIQDPILTSNNQEYIKVKDCYDAITLITNGTEAKPKEFPHMALLGYNKKPGLWACGGSLISKNFVLTAAHCEKQNQNPAIWARLGDLDYDSESDEANPKDYKIVERIIHPNYKAPSFYNDIALFRLERDVDFSPFIRPICLNTDHYLRPPAIIATGWGRVDTAELESSKLLKVSINYVPTEQCDESYKHMLNRNQKLSQGIVDDLMLCFGNPGGGNDTCLGDSGGPIQIIHNRYTCMYSQIGITSFGDTYCGEDKPGVYTRVSNYISWIEQIVWPRIK
ncbi:serine protease snake-like [Rhopalosiphum maidis]|uniref:serine protease snake-like n=1 Tax=Rhopalosiphum maidis TaxID=43146 RepID=UPI000F005C7C|nr:serine protease snake-like [Rhopalosiphum maidis]